MQLKREFDAFSDFQWVDHAPLRRDLRKLEGQARVLLSNKPPATDDSKECPPLLGMKINTNSRVVSRFSEGIGHDSMCRIDNDEQWNLFMLIVKNNGEVAATKVQNLLPISSQRNNARARLAQHLNKIQLTIRHEATKGYTIKEV